MAKKSVTARVDEQQLKRVSRYRKTHGPANPVRAALDYVAEKAAHDEIVRRYSGVGEPDAFHER